MAENDQPIFHTYQADTNTQVPENVWFNPQENRTEGQHPHIIFPPSPIFSTDISLAKSDLEPATTNPSEISEQDTLTQVAQENRIASGILAIQDHATGSTKFAAKARRPLSEMVETNPVRQETFKPAFEVDRFHWQEVSNRLSDPQSTLLDPIIEALQEATDVGRTLIGFLGAEPQVGCTTILLSVARRLAASGTRVAVVDADFITAAQAEQATASFDLASQLGLMVQVGWEDVLAGRVPLAEGVVQSVEDRIAILPIVKRPHTAHESLQIIQTHGIQASVTAGVLRYHYDVVLVDLGCATNPVQASTTRAIAQHCRLDATLMVTRDGAEESTPLHSSLQAVSPEIICLGRIENSAQPACSMV